MKFCKIKNFLENKQGAIALILVIMITTITLVSSVIISLVNTSNLLSNYQVSQTKIVNVDINSCVDDALWRLSYNVSTTGSFAFYLGDTACQYQVSQAIAGIKTVTATASTTSQLGAWQRTALLKVNISSTPLWIDSYHDASYYDDLSTAVTACGDWVCNGSETCSTCELDCNPCYCGDTICNNSETVITCPGDCPADCGDDYCSHTENASTCSADCPAICGDDYCTHTETWCSCEIDGCTSVCGDDCCAYDENGCSCSADCVSCGDGCCAGGETCEICPDDCGECGAVCGNGIKESGEACDYTGEACDIFENCSHNHPVGCSGETYCGPNCAACSNSCECSLL